MGVGGNSDNLVIDALLLVEKLGREQLNLARHWISPLCFHFSVYLSLTHFSCCPKYVEYLLSVISDDSSATPGFAGPKILATQWPLGLLATQNGVPRIVQSASNFWPRLSNIISGRGEKMLTKLAAISFISLKQEYKSEFKFFLEGNCPHPYCSNFCLMIHVTYWEFVVGSQGWKVQTASTHNIQIQSVELYHVTQYGPICLFTVSFFQAHNVFIILSWQGVMVPHAFFVRMYTNAVTRARFRILDLLSILY